MGFEGNRHYGITDFLNFILHTEFNTEHNWIRINKLIYNIIYYCTFYIFALQDFTEWQLGDWSAWTDVY